MPYVPISGFAPDSDPSTPGILVDADDVLPSIRGMVPFPGLADHGSGSVNASVRGAASLIKLDDTRRVFVGTPEGLRELSTATWSDVTRTAASGGSYSTTVNAYWTFAQYGNISFASQKGEQIQEMDSGQFENLSTAPGARIVEVVLDFVMAFNTKEATYGDSPDRWWCSGAGNKDTWTPNVATQANTGILYDAPGPITAAKKLGSSIVVYKERSMFFGQYVGPPDVWSFRLLPGTGIGTPGPYGVVDIRSAHVFVGFEDFYVFDGTRPQAIGTNRVAEFFFDDLNHNFKTKIVGFHDRQNWRVTWFYPSIAADTGSLDSYISYNYRGDRWGFGRYATEFAFEFFTPGVSYDEMGTYYSTYDDIPQADYDELFKPKGAPKSAVFTDNMLGTLEAVAGNSWMRTGDTGQDGVITKVERIRPRFKQSPATGTQTLFFRDDLGVSASQATIVTLTDGAFDSVYAARWLQSRQDYTGDYELLGWDVVSNPESPE